MNFKRFVSLFLVLMLVLGMGASLVGCGSPAEEEPAESEPAEEPAAEEAAPEFPKKPLTIIVPYSAGGSSDTGARIIAEVAEKYLGQKVLVENRPGGGGVIGQTAAANAKPDGYTLLMMTTSVALHPLMDQTTYTLDSFIPIVQQVFDPDYLIIRSDLPYSNWDELVAYAKEHPGEVKFGNTGAGTADSLVGKYVTQLAGIDVKHIPFDGDAKVTAAILGGHIDVFVGNLMALLSQIETGEVTPILNLTGERSEEMPDVPTAKDKGMDVNSGGWRGLGVPAGTPDEIVEILRDAFGKAVQDPEQLEKMDNVGIKSVYRSGEGFGDFISKQSEMYKSVLESMEALNK